MIILYNRSDRLGGNFISKLCQLIYSHYNNIQTLNENQYFKKLFNYMKLKSIDHIKRKNSTIISKYIENIILKIS